MTAPDPLLEGVASAILDDAPIDWAEVELRSEPGDRSLIEQLKLLATLRTVARTADPPETSTLDSWGHLQVFERVGSGAFGDVYRAWDPRLDREVALKLLPIDSTAGDSRKSAIIEEGRLLARVRHPNVVTLYGAERIGEQIGLWMELVKGRSLEDVLGEGRQFTFKEVVDLGVQLCNAVSAVHGAGLIHRDIKAQNVMLADDGRLVLMDFGTGRELAGEAETSVAGTPLYLAPEVLAGENATVQSDIYSTGVLLYRLLTRSFPVHASGLADLRRAHSHGERIQVRSARPGVPSRLARAIERAIDPQPDRRYESADTLSADLAAAANRPQFVRVAYVTVATLALVLIVRGGWLLQGRSTNDQVSSRPSGAAPVSTSASLATGARPVLSLAGQKFSPVLSPDGGRLAFIWQPPGQAANLYAKRLGTEGALQLTHTPGNSSSPAWSPDGRSIAYLHRFPNESTKREVRMVPAAGGSYRTIWSGDLLVGSGLDWSPDGTQLVLSARTSLSTPHHLLLLSVAAGEIESLTAPLSGSGDSDAVFSPDGHSVAFVRDTGTQAEINLLAFADRQPRRLMVAQSGIKDLAWSSNGRSLFFASDEGPGKDRLWRVGVPGGQLEPVSGTGAGATEPSVARGARRLVFLQNALDQNLYRAHLTADPPKSIEQLAATSRSETHPDISPDGSRVAFVSDRTGYAEIWTMDPQGAEPTQVTSLGSVARHPRWSPDGRRLAFVGWIAGANNHDIYVVDAAGGPPRRLTEQPSIEQWPTWSLDGRWIYFTSDRTGTWQIWKVPNAGGVAEQVTTDGALKGWESRDGQFVLYSGGTRGIWRMPIGGGPPVRVFDFPHLTHWGGEWVPADRGLIFLNVDPSGPTTFELFDFSTGRIRRIFTLPGPYDTGSGFAVSRDGTWLLYPQRDLVRSEIMLMDVDR